MNPQAEELNRVIAESNNVVLNLLSKKGKNSFFPEKGILRQTAAAQGKKINATIGAAVLDDGTPMRLNCLENLVNIDPSQVFPYASSFGRIELRNKWKEMLIQKNPSLKNKDFSLPVVSNALTHGLNVIGYLFMNEGDTIIMPDLYWGNYNLTFKNSFGVEFNHFKLYKDGGFNTEGLNQKLEETSGKQIIILNFPNNPTGYTPTEKEYEEIVDVIKKSADRGNEILVICDDAYFGLVFEDEVAKYSIFEKVVDLHENVLAIKVDGPTKEDYVWGFRVGFITFGIKGGDETIYTALANKTGGVIRGNISNTTNLSQSLLLKSYNCKNYPQEKEEKFQILKSRYNKVKDVIKDGRYDDMFKALPFNSGYFMCVELKNGIDSEELRLLLLDKYDTGVISTNNVIRVAFSAISEDLIPLLFENIYNACKELS